MNPLSHGNFDLFVENNVVHTFPSGGFNPEGIIEIRQEILKHAKTFDWWILFEHPGNKAGLTPEAVKEIVRSFQHFEQAGCKAIAMEVHPTWGWAMHNSVAKNINIPLCFDEDKTLVEQWIKSYIRDNHFSAI